MCSDIDVNQIMLLQKECEERAKHIDEMPSDPTVTKKRKHAKPRIETKECGTQTLELQPNNDARTNVSKKLKRIHKKLQKIISQMEH